MTAGGIENVDDLSMLVDGLVDVPPDPVDLHVGLVHEPSVPRGMAREPRRRRSRIGEPTVRIRTRRHRQQGTARQRAAPQTGSRGESSPPVVRRQPTNRRTRPSRPHPRPTRHSPPRATSRAVRTDTRSPPDGVSAAQTLSRMLCVSCPGHKPAHGGGAQMIKALPCVSLRIGAAFTSIVD